MREVLRYENEKRGEIQRLIEGQGTEEQPGTVWEKIRGEIKREVMVGLSEEERRLFERQCLNQS